MTAAATGRKISFRSLMLIMLGLCGAMFAYMCVLMRTVPKSAESSKAGLFAEMVEDLMAPDADPKPASESEAIAAFNARLLHYVPQGGLQIGNLGDWKVQSWAESKVHGRPILRLRLRDNAGKEILLALFALAKRHFPKTGGFAYKDAWFFTYGKDHDEALLPEHQKEVKALKDKGLNLVATNYGNDYFLLMLSDIDSQELAKKFFSLTTIYQSAP